MTTEDLEGLVSISSDPTVAAELHSPRDGTGLDAQTSNWIAEFAKQPPRENRGIDDLRWSYRQTLIDGSFAPDPSVSVQVLDLTGAVGPIKGRFYTKPSAVTPEPLIL